MYQGVIRMSCLSRVLTYSRIIQRKSFSKMFPAWSMKILPPHALTDCFQSDIRCQIMPSFLLGVDPPALTIRAFSFCYLGCLSSPCPFVRSVTWLPDAKPNDPSCIEDNSTAGGFFSRSSSPPWGQEARLGSDNSGSCTP